MQAGKNAMESMKESAANVAASARSGMEKTKATVQEKMEKMTAEGPVAKEMAEEKKQERIREAELDKQMAREHNAATRQAATAKGTHDTHPTTTHGAATYTTTGALGSGQPGRVTEGVVGSHPHEMHSTGTHGTTTYSTTGAHGYSTGTQQMSAVPGHGTGQPAGRVTEGVVESHPIGTQTGTGTTARNPRVGGGGATGYGTGGGYS